MNYFYTYTDIFLQSIGLRQKPFFIPTQTFSLPTPLLRHILSNAFLSNQLKLFKSCKLFRNFYRKFPGLQVQLLKFINVRKFDDECEIDGQNLSVCSNFFLEHLKMFLALKPRQLKYEDNTIYAGVNYRYLPHSFIFKLSQTLDFSILENLYLQFHTIEKMVLMPYLVHSLKCLQVFFFNVGNEDILEIILLNAPNLKELFCTLQQNTNTLKNALKVQKSTKLYISYFFGVHVYPSAVDVANYIIRHMEPDGRLKFAWREYSNTSEPTLEKYKNEILLLLELKSGTNKFEQFNIFLP